MPSDDVLSVAEAATRLRVTEPRISQLLSERCQFAEPPIFELESPQGRPVGTSRVRERTITLSSIETYEARHPWSANGKRRKRHPARDKTRPTLLPPRDQTGVGSSPTGGASSVQVLRLELEHQLDLKQQLIENLEAQQHSATERARAFRHQIVDLKADLELKTSTADSFAEKLAGLQSAFDAYGEVFTQDVGPQDSSGV